MLSSTGDAPSASQARPPREPHNWPHLRPAPPPLTYVQQVEGSPDLRLLQLGVVLAAQLPELVQADVAVVVQVILPGEPK